MWRECVTVQHHVVIVAVGFAHLYLVRVFLAHRADTFDDDYLKKRSTGQRSGKKATDRGVDNKAGAGLVVAGSIAVLVVMAASQIGL